MSSRREFILHCSALTVAAAGVPLIFDALVPASRRVVRSGEVCFTAFARLVGAKFSVQRDSGTTAMPMELELVEARAGGTNGASRQPVEGGEPEEFSLTFSGPVEQSLAQNSYLFEHKAMGRFLMFIVPVRRDDPAAGRQKYQAVFNRPATLTLQPTLIHG